MPVNTRQNHGMQNALEALEEIVQQNGLARSWEDEGLGTTVTLTIRRDEYLILYQAACSWKDGTKKDVHHNLAQNFVEILEGCLHYNRWQHQRNISVQGVSLRASDRDYRTVFQCHAKWAATVVGAHRAIGCVFLRGVLMRMTWSHAHVGGSWGSNRQENSVWLTVHQTACLAQSRSGGQAQALVLQWRKRGGPSIKALVSGRIKNGSVPAQQLPQRRETWPWAKSEKRLHRYSL